MEKFGRQDYLVKSVEDILDEVNSLPDIEAVVVTSEGKVYYTSGVLDRIIC